jgi:hypothetical protein
LDGENSNIPLGLMQIMRNRLVSKFHENRCQNGTPNPTFEPNLPKQKSTLCGAGRYGIPFFRKMEKLVTSSIFQRFWTVSKNRCFFDGALGRPKIAKIDPWGAKGPP